MARDSFDEFTHHLAAYYGIARVALDHLWFDETAPDARTVDPAIVTRLLRRFQHGQCDRLAADHYIAATVSPEILARALERGHISRKSLESPEPCFLPLEGDERVVGIRGIHRYKAAQQYLTDGRWWVVRLYDERVLTEAARRNLAWSGVLLQDVPSGEVYRRIRLAHHHGDWEWKTAWTHSIRSDYVRADIHRLQNLDSQKPLRIALDRLLHFPGLWMDFSISFFHNLGAASCMESLVAFLHVLDVRLSNMLCGLNPHNLDVGTIRFLQGRCPALSEKDQKDVERALEQKRIFPHVTDHQERECLKERLLTQNTIIPSLKTWSKAVNNYLKPGASLLKPLLDGSSQNGPQGSERAWSSIQQAARASFRPARVPVILASPDCVNRHFWDAYRRLWIAAMDHLLVVQSGASGYSMQHMSQVAYQLGFSSDAIRYHICDAGVVSGDTGPESVPRASHRSSPPAQIRLPAILPHFRNLQARRDRLTFDSIYAPKSAERMKTLAEFEIFRDAFRSFFPVLPPIIDPLTGNHISKPPSAASAQTRVDIDAWIEELKNGTMNDPSSTSRGASHVHLPRAWSTDSGSFYSRDASEEIRSSTQARGSRISAGRRPPRLLHQSPNDLRTSSEPGSGLLGVECTLAPALVQNAMCEAKGTWIYHATSPPMLYKLPPPRAQRIFLDAIVQRGPNYRYAILDENGASQEIPSDRALEFLGRRLILYRQCDRPDPLPKEAMLNMALVPPHLSDPSRAGSEVTNREPPWEWI